MYKQFFTFAFIGCFNTAIDFLVYWLLLKINVQYHIALTISFIMAVTFSYFCNRKWTFPKTGNNTQKEFSKFFIVNIVSFLVMQAGVTFLVEVFQMNKVLSKVFVTPIVLMINFSGNKLWTFKKA